MILKINLVELNESFTCSLNQLNSYNKKGWWMLNSNFGVSPNYFESLWITSNHPELLWIILNQSELLGIILNHQESVRITLNHYESLSTTTYYSHKRIRSRWLIIMEKYQETLGAMTKLENMNQTKLFEKEIEVTNESSEAWLIDLESIELSRIIKMTSI